jgi:hypothetical protein
VTGERTETILKGAVNGWMSDKDVKLYKATAQKWMKQNASFYPTATELAEACAEDMGVYLSARTYQIPEDYFEWAAKCYPDE